MTNDWVEGLNKMLERGIQSFKHKPIPEKDYPLVSLLMDMLHAMKLPAEEKQEEGPIDYLHRRVLKASILERDEIIKDLTPEKVCESSFIDANEVGKKMCDVLNSKEAPLTPYG